MKEFNENPFKKDTPVVPFSNGTEAEDWYSNNCGLCKKKPNCNIEPEIAKGFVNGTIPLWSAKEIGCEYNPLYQTCRLDSMCRMFDDGNENNPW